MPDRYPYNYAIIRVVPRVDRDEFINVGVMVSCPALGFLDARIALDEQRVRLLDSTADVAALHAHLAAISTMCAGGVQAGPIGRLSQRERFYWLSAPRSTIIQVSPVHTGFCTDPAAALQRLFDIVGRPPRENALATTRSREEPSQERGEKKDEHTVRLLAITGSLRADSSNTTLLRAAAALAPDGIAVQLYAGLGELPHFNPDIEDSAPPVVKEFAAQIGAADGLIFSTPEYAHGMPGALKNALDWLVGGFDFINKPIALFNASPRSTYAIASLTEVVTIMSGRIVPGASVTIPLRELHLDEAGIVAHPEISLMIRTALTSFAVAIKRYAAQDGV